MEKLRSRLEGMGFKDGTNFKFVKNLSISDTYDEASREQCDEQPIALDHEEKDVIPIKTLVWRVSYSGGDNECLTNEEKFTESFSRWRCDYAITALLSNDRIVPKRLMNHIQQQILKRNAVNDEESPAASAIPIVTGLSLADKETAESITGFPSGTMPPVALDCYYQDQIKTSPQNTQKFISLFIDTGIFKIKEKNDDNVLCSFGSGSITYSTETSLKVFLTLAENFYGTNHQHQHESFEGGVNVCAISMSSVSNNDVKTDCEANNVMETNKEDVEFPEMEQLLPLSHKSLYHPEKKKNSPTQKHRIKTASRILRNHAGKKGRITEMKALIDEIGPAHFSSLMEIGKDGNFTKGALHLAAWKGDLEMIDLLIDTHRLAAKRKGEQKESDSHTNSSNSDVENNDENIVNVISVGIGNYGKTPIFYALTQNRDAVVVRLIEQGANLLIVNNKGQTPCSMAPSHLTKETCEFMYQTESQQLRSGKNFVNYRLTHSDSNQYGDLDPRFEIDDANMGDDIRPEIANFQTLMAHVEPAECSTTVIPLGFPRSLRFTTVDIRKARAEEKKLKDCAVNRRNCEATKSNTKSSRRARPTFESLCQKNGIAPELQDIITQLERNKEKAQALRPGRSLKIDHDHIKNYSQHKTKPLDSDTFRIDELGILSLGDVLPCGHGQNNDKAQQSPCFTLVDDSDAVTFLSHAIDDHLTNISNDAGMNNKSIVQNCWGLDCEWKPSRTKGVENPIATLQLSTRKQAFLVDLQSLCKRQSDAITDCNTDMTTLESFLSDALGRIFSCEEICILGFGIGQDIAKLAASFPHLPCFRLFQSVIDLHEVARYINISCNKPLTSLQKAVAFLIGKRLDKSMQCSNWELRPLTVSQIEYAVLDAAILPSLLSTMLQSNDGHIYGNDAVGNDTGFLQNNPELRLSFRFVYLNQNILCNEESRYGMYQIENGRIKRILEGWFSKQVWVTGDTQPPLPLLVQPRGSLSLDAKKLKKQNTPNKGQESSKPKKSRSTRRKDRVMLCDFEGDIVNLPSPGNVIDYAKESCVQQILGHKVMSDLGNKYLSYNRRGGSVELSNMWILFINFGEGELNANYTNEFRDRGRQVTFFIKPGKLLYDLLSTNKNQPENGLRKKTDDILLFVKLGKKYKFMFCGKVACVDKVVSEENVKLTLQLLNYDELVQNSSDYMQIVSFLGHGS